MLMFYLLNDKGEMEVVVDLIFFIWWFEVEFLGRSVVLKNLVLGFLDYLLEDFVDEWLIKYMFYYCWYYKVDIDKVGIIFFCWYVIFVLED